MAGHADNQASDSIAALLMDVLPEDVVAAQDGVGFLAESRVLGGSKKRARGAKLRTEELQSSGFLPVGEVLSIRNSRGLEELGHREVMGAAVLPDIEIDEMESEDSENALHGPDGLADQAVSADLLEAFGEDGEILGDLFGASVAVSGFGDPCPVGRPDLERPLKIRLVS